MRIKNYVVTILASLFLEWRLLVSAKVVVFFPIPTTSHVRYHTDVARAVAQLGHDAWVCVPDYLVKSSHVDTSGITVLRYGQSLGDIEDSYKSTTRIHENFWENRTRSIGDVFEICDFFDQVATDILKDGLFEKVKAVKPDLFVLGCMPFVRKIVVIPYKLGVPYAVIGTVHDTLAYRVPFSPSAAPLQMVPLNDQMDFWSRLENALAHTVYAYYIFIHEPDTVSNYAPEKPHKTLNGLIAKAEVFISELDPIMDYPRPMLPNTKLIGGTTVKDAKPLKEPFKDFMDKAKRGVILVSFGSTLAHVPSYIFNKINTACKNSGLSVVWRSDEISPDPSRILTKDWIPQNDLLGHSNTELFISHCGKNGQYESLYHGVPILCLPISGDQPYNAERIQAKGYGMKADMRCISTEDLSAMVKELLTNSMYKDNMTKASKLFRLLYKFPMKEAAFWLDHVMEFGGDYMRAASQKMPYYQFLMLDVVAVVLAIAVFVVVVGVLLIRGCVRLCCRSSKSSSKRKSKSQ